MPFQVRLEGFGALDITVRNLQRQILRRVPGNTSAVRIELGLIKIVAVFIRLTAGEDAAFNFYPAEAGPDQTRGCDAEGDVRRILPMMTERRVRIIQGSWAMHECRRTERRFTRITEIDVGAEIVLELLRETHRQFVEEIVRMLSIMQWLAVPRFAALKEKRIAAALLS